MRQIKFRAWDTVVHRMLSWEEVRHLNLLEIQPKTHILLQFTGLLDKDEREIYEGDIIEFTAQEGVWDDQVGKYTVEYPFICGNSHLGEVIGNIYENPELVEEPNNE